MKRRIHEHEDYASPTVVCAWCARVLHEGAATISHGICHECAVEFIATVTGEAATAQRRLAAV